METRPLLRRVWTRRTLETVMWVPSASKARTRPTLHGCALLRRFQLRLCLCRDSVALMSCSSTRLLVLPRPRRPLRGVRPCLSRNVGRTLRRCLPLGSGSGLVSSSVPWDEFVRGLWECVLPENEEVGVTEVIEKVPQNSEGQVPEGHVTNLALLARLHGLEESNLTHWIFEFWEEEGLMRAIDEMLDRLNFETESVASEVPWKGDVLQVDLKVTEKEEVCFCCEDQVDWDFKRCMAGLLWQSGICVYKGKAWGRVLMATLPLWVGGY